MCLGKSRFALNSVALHAEKPPAIVENSQSIGRGPGSNDGSTCDSST